MVNDILFKPNFKNTVWYHDYIYQSGVLIGEIHTDITEGGYNLRKLVPLEIVDGTVDIMETVAHFANAQDAKQFVIQAGGL